MSVLCATRKGIVPFSVVDELLLSLDASMSGVLFNPAPAEPAVPDVGEVAAHACPIPPAANIKMAPASHGLYLYVSTLSPLEMNWMQWFVLARAHRQALLVTIHATTTSLPVNGS
jgi:hypothetical protein